jgi:hypothetical protein
MSAKRVEEPMIVLEANDNDVLLGRGNAVNFRGGNVRFRQLAQNKALRYATCSNKLEKDRIAASILTEIKSLGGRFLRPISARNDTGEHLSAWEPVDEEVAMTKAKQTLRDCAAAIRKETAMKSTSTSPTSYESPSLFQSAISGTLSRGGGAGQGGGGQGGGAGAGFGSNNSFLGNAASSTAAASQDSSALAMSLQRFMLEQLGSNRSTMMESLGSSTATNSGGSATAALRAALTDRLPYGLTSQMVLDDQQSRLLQAIRQQQQQLVDLESTSDGTSSGLSSSHLHHHHHHPFHQQQHHQQPPTSVVSNALVDVQRARETLLIQQYQRERAIAEAQQRMIWNQLSEQARARYDASMLHPSPVAVPMDTRNIDSTLLQLLEAQCLQNLRGTDRLVSSASESTSAASIRPDALTRLLMMQNQVIQPLEHSSAAAAAAAAGSNGNKKDMATTTTPRRKSSVSSDEEERGSTSSLSQSSDQPPTKKARWKTSKQQDEDGSDA